MSFEMTQEQKLEWAKKVVAYAEGKKMSDFSKSYQKEVRNARAIVAAAGKPQLKVNSNEYLELLKGYTNEVNSTFDKQQRDMALQVVQAVSMLKGFAADVASSVLKYGKMSDKQAFVIAKAAQESGKFEIKNNMLYVK